MSHCRLDIHQHQPTLQTMPLPGSDDDCMNSHSAACFLEALQVLSQYPFQISLATRFLGQQRWIHQPGSLCTNLHPGEGVCECSLRAAWSRTKLLACLSSHGSRPCIHLPGHNILQVCQIPNKAVTDAARQPITCGRAKHPGAGSQSSPACPSITM